MLRTKLVRRAGRLLGAVTVAGVLLTGSAGAAQASVLDQANGIKQLDASTVYIHVLDIANGI
jgi:hypothetical protein